MAKVRKRNESAAIADESGEQRPQSGGDSSIFGEGSSYENGDHRDRVAMRAYELYLARGGGDGGDFEDWLAAEREVGSGNGNASRGDAGE